MWKKRLLISLLIFVGLCVALVLGLRFHLTQNLYIKPMSDEDLIAILFDIDFPGYSQITILESEGKGIRRIPRHILIEVTMESYPEPSQCLAEIYFDVGDPMALNSQWRTIQCVGQHLLMEHTNTVMKYGMTPSNVPCQQDRITHLLAYWIRTGVIEPSDITSPEYREAVLSWAEDPDRLAAQDVLDGGFFNLAEAVVYDLAKDADKKYPRYVLRCDGSLDVYLTKSHNLPPNQAKLIPGDRILPDTHPPQEYIP
jgi:hypothetical protein